MAMKRLTYAPNPADRRKHKEHWSRSRAGIQQGYPVGKCPADMSLEIAQELLDEGIHVPERADRRSPYPREVFNVHAGIPYRAHQKGPGRYHGFPERPSRISPTILEELKRRAERAGDLEAFEEWRREVDVDED